MNKKYKVELEHYDPDGGWLDILITAPSGKQRSERFTNIGFGWEFEERDQEDFSRFILACDKWDYKWKRKLAEVRRKGVIYLDPEHYVEHWVE